MIRIRSLIPTILVSVLLVVLATSGIVSYHVSHSSRSTRQTAGEVATAARCSPSAPLREERIAAINVEMSLNRFLDYDPEGRMFVREAELARVRAEETQNREARGGKAQPAVSSGLQGDAVQPLTLRVNQGECLRIVLRNALNNDEPVSVAIRGAGLYVAGTGSVATASNVAATARPGQSVTYEWMVAADEPEGTHALESNGIQRLQAGHGLFGAVIVEQKGARWLDPRDPSQPALGWDAIVEPPSGSSFREFVYIYHEIGNELFQTLDKAGKPIDLTDNYAGTYKPAGRAMNYRSEPFRDRLMLQEKKQGYIDLSTAYSSYSFGDPATPMARSYIGDPVKMRLVHGGSEVFHVHHVHGGSIRWLRQPGTEDTRFDEGFAKKPPLVTTVSSRIDSQAIGPGESYDIENECGSGGCQEAAGDFLVHCHVANHYLSGMWTIWRVYNTMQNGKASTDTLPALATVPGRPDAVVAGVDSTKLVGTTVNWKGTTFALTTESLDGFVRQQLPPQGVPDGYDASVMNWEHQGNLYLNQPQDTVGWENYSPDRPGQRQPILFDPKTGKLAYPLLQPHLGQRPPFAPGHGPAPFLEPSADETKPIMPGAVGAWGLCPMETVVQSYQVEAIQLPITINKKANMIDPVGQLYVLKEQESSIRSTPSLQVPLVLRANAGEDCVDVTLRSSLVDDADNHELSKANIHIHFVQFDVQGSDGVNTGYNYEQSIRPYTAVGQKLRTDARAGSNTIEVADTKGMHPGALLGVGLDQDKGFEVLRVASIQEGRVTFVTPLKHDHRAGEYASSEFVRYRWYPDAQVGTTYFHDHVHATTSWRHGLVGALIVEPPGSTYTDPQTGAPLRVGPIADVRTTSKVSPEITGSFREMVLMIQDDNPITRIGKSSGSSINLRVEPLQTRGGDPSMLFSSSLHGDPETPILQAYANDPLVIRTLVVGANDVHTMHMDGNWFKTETFSQHAQPTTTLHVGISERFDIMVPKAGGVSSMPGDYLYYNGRAFKLREGSWGLIRVLPETGQSPLLRLPGRVAANPAPGPVCPPNAPVKSFAIAAMEAPMPMFSGAPGRLFALANEVEAVRSGTRSPQPLVLHINVGDCLQVNLTNDLPSGQASFHVDRLVYDPANSQGIAAGTTPSQSVAPGQSRGYTFYAHPALGEGGSMVTDWGDVLNNPALGLYAAVVVGPAGARYTHPITGMDIGSDSAWAADVHTSDGLAYRDFSLFFQDEDPLIGTQIMPYTDKVSGNVGLNYAIEPFARRLVLDPDPATLFNCVIRGDPATPVMLAHLGDPVRIHALMPYSEQGQVFALEGHRWRLESLTPGSLLLSAVQIGPMETLDVTLSDGAGGPAGAIGDFVYGDHRGPYLEAGLWGILRTLPGGNTLVKPLKRD